MRKILFPFFKDHHRFLLGKWWFRLALVIYVIALVVSPFAVGLGYLNSQTDWCYDSLSFYYDDTKLFNNQLEECQVLARALWDDAIVAGILIPIFSHYLFQLILFKLVIDFIALGRKRI